MKSIRSKLFLQIGILIIGMITLLLAVNTWLAEPYYIYTQQQQMIQFYEQIKDMDMRNKKQLDELFSTMEQEYGIEILLLDNEQSLIYASGGYQSDKRTNEDYDEPIPHVTIENIKTLEDGAEFTKTTQGKFGIENLLLSNELSNGYIIEFKITIHYIKTAIQTINEILLVIGALFIIISSIFAFLLSGSFTKPIINITNATKKMSKLDFEVHCEVQSNDELGTLSESINHMSEVLSDTIETLHIRDEKRRILLNNVSHELKTPLTLMQGYAVGLKQSVIANPKKTDFYTGVIIDETVKMNRLVESLLDIDQLETDVRELNIRTFNINAFVDENIRRFESIMDDKGITYSVTMGKEMNVECDPDLTEQVMKNLLSNAILHIGEPKKIDIEVVPNDTSVSIRITNTCEQINEEEIGKLWDRFYKKDKARTREQGGHGLGLSIVKAIQEAHHQGYGAELVEDGVCFWFDMKLTMDMD